MGIGDIIERTSDGLAAHTVFGEGVERDGVVVIPAARVIGGGGGGEGTGSLGSQDRSANNGDRSGEGAGGGFGLRARPVGAFVIRDRTVHWRPAIDGNLVVLMAAALGFAALLLGRSMIKRRD